MTTMDYYNKNVESNGTYVPVERYTDEYCKALTENYKQDTMRSYERYIMKGDSAEYYGERLLEILRGEANLDKSGIKELLSTSEGRKTIGYNYLNLYNPPEEISYDGVKKSGKRKGQVLVYNKTEGLNRQQRRM